MKAATLYNVNEPLQIKDLQQDQPKAGEVRVKMSVAGICASDHHVMTGTAILDMPVVLGHEGAGTVVEVGPGVTKVKPGDRCILTFISSCGHCRPCRTGTPQLCDTNGETGVKQYDGTVRLHDADGNARVPEEILPLVRPAVGTQAAELLLYNGGQEDVQLTWRSGEGDDRKESLAAGEVVLR